MTQLDYHKLDEEINKKLYHQKVSMHRTAFLLSVFLSGVIFLFIVVAAPYGTLISFLLLGWFTTFTLFGITTLVESGICDNFMKKQILSDIIDEEMLQSIQVEIRNNYEKMQRSDDEYNASTELGDNIDHKPKNGKQKRAPKEAK